MTILEAGRLTGHDHEGEKIEAFGEQQAIMARIAEVGFEKHAEGLSDLPDAFDLEKHKPAEDLHTCICCMDERTPYGKHLAGSGILLPEDAFEKAFKKSGADSISSHTGCGAARIYAEKMGLNPADSDRIGREWAEKMAEKMGVPHIPLEVEVDKPFHYARVCYYDGTGKFNYAGVEGLPAGFVVGRKNMDKEASLAECGVAENIAFGDHGFGREMLSESNPFWFVAVGNTPKETERLKDELAELVHTEGNNVVIDGFTAPEEK